MNRLISRIVKALSSNKSLFIFGMLSAVVIWFYVAGIESPETTKIFKDITLNVSTTGTEAETNGLMLLKGAPKTVNVELTGSRSDLATFNRANITAKIDFNAITAAGTYTLPVNVVLPDNRLSVSSVSPGKIDVTFSVKKTVSVNVKVNVTGNVSDNYIADTPRAYPTSISVTGPEELVDTIANASVSVDVTKATETIVKKSVYTLLDANGNEVSTDNITTDVEKVSVTCPVLFSKSVPTSITIINSSGGADSKFATVTIEPKSITIAGTADELSSVNSIELGKIDMAEIANDGIEKDFELSLPNGIKSLDTIQKIHVKVTYPEIVTKEFDVTNFSIINTSSDKTASPVSSSVKVTVRGLAADIAALTSDNIKAVVDLTDVSSTGRIRHAVTFEFPADSNVGAYGVYTALIRIS